MTTFKQAAVLAYFKCNSMFWISKKKRWVEDKEIGWRHRDGLKTYIYRRFEIILRIHLNVFLFKSGFDSKWEIWQMLKCNQMRRRFTSRFSSFVIILSYGMRRSTLQQFHWLPISDFLLLKSTYALKLLYTCCSLQSATDVADFLASWFLFGSAKEYNSFTLRRSRFEG